MDVDLEVLCTTINDYGQAIEDLTDIKDKVQNTNTTLADKGWTGEAQKKYNELLKWFLSKDYELLMENLKCVKTILYNEAKYPGGALKDRCEDFVNCLDGSEKGFYSEESGASSGVLSLEYDNTNSVISYVEDVLDDLIPKKKKILNELESTIHGGWFSSGLIYCSFSIDNELAESSNQIKKEETGLTAFLESFTAYTNGVRSLESRVSEGLSKVKDLETTVEKNIQKMDDAANMTTMQKIRSMGKTVTIDIIGGGMTASGGISKMIGGAAALEETGGVSAIYIVQGGAMVGSGTNCAYNGVQDLYREVTGDWVDVGSTNLVKDSVSNFATNASGNEKIGNIIGSTVVTVMDVGGSAESIWSTTKDIPKQVVNVGKKAANIPSKILGPYGFGGKVSVIENYGTNFATINVTRKFPITNIGSMGSATNSTYNSIVAVSRVGKDAYDDANSYYSLTTDLGDANIDYTKYINKVLGIQEVDGSSSTTNWLEAETRNK